MENFLVLGLAKSGVAACNLLIQKNKKVFAYDKNKTLFEELVNAKILSKKVEKIKKLSKKTLKNINFVVISPGISDKKIKRKLLKSTKILSEIELASMFSKSPILAITGTNGKTTTVNLLSTMLECDDKKNFLVGNVGVPFSEKVLLGKQKDFFVCEVSSFQLEHIQNFKPKIAGFLNIENDHLNRYKNFESYFLAKQNIFKAMTKNDVAVLNFDDLLVKNLAEKLKCDVKFFSTSVLPEGVEGAFCDGNNFVFRLNGKTETLSFKNKKLLGQHNVSNLLCSCLMSKLVGTSNDSIKSVVENFSGLSHRIEFVGLKNGVKFFDDSKATNIHSSLTAINVFNQKILLLLGGSDKHENFEEFFQNKLDNVSKIIAFGQMGKKIQKIAKKSGFFNVIFAKTLKDGLNLIKKVLKDEKIVLLSPACASFDEFSGYEERGDFFKKFVKDF